MTPAQSGPNPDYFAATITLDKLTASVHFYESRGFRLVLGDLFTSIAKDWRGWTGEKKMGVDRG